MIEALVVKITEDLRKRNQPEPKVIITGGHATKISEYLPDAAIEENLTLTGLSLIHLLNQK